MRGGKLILMVLAFVMALAGCNTVKGIGKDVQKAGEAIESAGN